MRYERVQFLNDSLHRPQPPAPMTGMPGKWTKYLRSLGRTFIAVLVMAGCDTFEEDVVQPVVSVSGEVVYVPIGGESIIDLGSLISSNVPVEVEITKHPRLGYLDDLGSAIYRYTPYPASSGRDSIGFTVRDLNQTMIFTNTVIVNVQAIPDDLPCGNYAVADYAFYYSDHKFIRSVFATGNDRLCSDDVTISVHKPSESYMPHFGVAEVTTYSGGQFISYHAGAGFSTTDTIMYKVVDNSNPSNVAYGLIFVNGKPDCKVILNNDVVRLTNTNEYGQYFIDVFSNDEYCTDLDEFYYSTEIVKEGRYGTCLISDEGVNEVDLRMYYTLSNNAPLSFVDTVKYQACLTGYCSTATIVVKRNKTDCFFEAVDDAVDFSGNAIQAVNIDALRNDQLCNALSSMKITIPPQHGSATVDQATNTIHYTRKRILNDALEYEICNGTACSRGMVYIKQ